MEILILIGIGYLVYKMIRHPITTIKIVGAVIGCLLLGTVVVGALFVGFIALLGGVM